MHKTNKIYFFSDGVEVSLKSKKKLKKFIERVFKHEGKRLTSLNFIFCPERELLKTNKNFLGHNFFTDVITFDLSRGHESIDAEIHISPERVRDNANKFGVSFNKELHRVIFHGILHLCGYNDKTIPQKTKIRELEDRYLAMYFSK